MKLTKSCIFEVDLKQKVKIYILHLGLNMGQIDIPLVTGDDWGYTPPTPPNGFGFSEDHNE